MKSLEKASDSVDGRINEIYETWQVRSHPSFLKGCYMKREVWERMKWMLGLKVLEGQALSSAGQLSIGMVGSATQRHQLAPIVLQLMRSALLPLLDVQVTSHSAIPAHAVDVLHVLLQPNSTQAIDRPTDDDAHGSIWVLSKLSAQSW